MNRLERWLYRFSKSRSRCRLYDWIEEAAQVHGLRGAGAVLNVGAGGDIAACLDRLGVRYVSVDVDPVRGPDHVASAEDLALFPDATFDAVFCFEVLEHVERPDAAIREIRRVLKPGGRLIGSTPFLLGIHDAPADYRRFTRHGLERLLSGFAAIDLRPRNRYFDAVAVLVTRCFAIGPPEQRRRVLFLSPLLLALSLVLELLDRWLPRTDATTGYFFVARKVVV